MDFYPIWPAFAGFAVLFLLAGLAPFASADLPPSPRAARVPTIDGLRGFLSLGVMFHHGAIYHRYLLDGVWAVPPTSFYRLLGSGGVSVFFMITGYLFWGQLIDQSGRLDWARFYVGRLFRIGPLYLLMLLVLLVMVMSLSGWRLLPPARFLQGLAPWLALGLVNAGDINGWPGTRILIAAVTWSLRYEWLFYLALPLLAVAAGRDPARAGIMLVLVAGGFLWASWHGSGTPYVLDPVLLPPFLVGMGCATLDRMRWGATLDDRIGSAAVVVLLLTVAWTCQTAYVPLAAALLGLCFYLIVSGCTLFGLLTHRASRRLGDISYGIYLFQGLVLAALFQDRWLRKLALASPLRHWAIVLIAAVILVVLAAAAHRWVERPGIALGRRIARLLPAHAVMHDSPVTDGEGARRSVR